MNTERILELADIIERQPHVTSDADEGFCMDVFRHDCGTPSCIGGWAIAEFDQNRRTHETTPDQASRLLGLSSRVGHSLFFPGMDRDYKSITPAIAAAVLRHLAETGEVDWSVGAPVEA